MTSNISVANTTSTPPVMAGYGMGQITGFQCFHTTSRFVMATHIDEAESVFSHALADIDLQLNRARWERLIFKHSQSLGQVPAEGPHDSRDSRRATGRACPPTR